MMSVIAKLEQIGHSSLKGVPHLPLVWRKWFGENIWWIVLAAAIFSGISALFEITGVIGTLSIIGTVAAKYYSSSAGLAWGIVSGLVSFAFIVFSTVLLAMAVMPLKERQKKGWVLLFASWLVSVASVFINGLLTLNVIYFALSLMFGAVFLAATGYLLFEIHGQFAHVEKTKDVKTNKL